MTEEKLRAKMRKQFESISMSEWCRLNLVHKGHMSEFMNGHRGPCSDLLRALDLRVDYVKVRRAG